MGTDVADASQLGWYHRTVPRWCCSPHYPHLSQDKLILIQDGHIINRRIIDDLSEIKAGKEAIANKARERQQRSERREHLNNQKEQPVHGTESLSGSISSPDELKEQLSLLSQ